MTSKSRRIILTTVLCILAVTVIGFIVNYIALQDVAKIEKQMFKYDIEFFWVGDLTPGISGLGKRLNRAEAGSLSEYNMPAEKMQGYPAVVELMPDGRTKYKIINNDCLIVIYKAELTSSDLNVLYKCVIRNGIPVLVIGQRSSLAVAQKLGVSIPEDSGSFYYGAGGYKADPVNTDQIMLFDLCKEILRFTIRTFGYSISG